ncbi:myelin-associated glyco -like isoform X2 [Labeo rohita]|uniref:Myelin-associated glyco-like isoform X2 n=1 Tax=Labeo rohita TaxID=84645 RepID=A0A498MKZ3_LABRO|nr:myelin-associated glyco -like isoform X2 [Labeo rohita]
MMLWHAQPRQPSIYIYGGERTGDTATVACSIFHTCPYSKPTITLKGIEGSDEIQDESIKDSMWKTTLTRTEYQKPAIPVQNETYFQYVADVIPKITALPRSCVVIPCSFKMEEEFVTRLRVLWVTRKGGYMFHTDPVDVLDNFKGRTRLLGNPDEQNCTVEMDNVRTHDNGPFCFRAERENERYSFNNSCVFIIMRGVQGVGFGPYVIASSLVFIFICILAGVFIYKRRHKHQSPRANTNLRAEYNGMMNLPSSQGKQHMYGVRKQAFLQTTCAVTKKGKPGSIMRPLLIYLLLQGVLLYDTLAWEVRMPKQIHGLQGSCLVIPCSFSYSSYPPNNPNRVVWYHWDSIYYPTVYDKWKPNDVSEKFRGKTELYGNPSRWDCSLLIKNLDLSHQGEKVYAWIDPENVGRSTYRFFDVTSTILVDGHPQQPIISIYGGDRTGILLYDALGWEVSMPKDIHGLKGSCLVIPCSFSYKSNPPKNPRRVVWYERDSKGSPLVYDRLHPNDVNEKFKGKTGLYGESDWDCSLLIKNLELSHNREKLYTRIDPENIAWQNYETDDATSTVLVDATPQQPSISITGGEKTGDTVTVECSTFHSCPYSKPTITLNGIEGSDETKDESIKNGLWKIILTRTGVIKAESTTIKCSVTHYGGITVTATEVKTSKCVHHTISIEPELADVTEGVGQNFTCTIYHSCQKENPVITWNYENMQVSAWNKKHSDSDQFRIAFSNITFLGAKEDNGKRLICTATFSGGNIETYVVLRVEEYQKPVDQILNETYFQYVADVIPKITALPRSCVVIPCSFKTEDEYLTRLRVLWVNRKGGYMFHTDPVDVLDNFKGRTKLLGNPDEQNCTVEMDNVQTHDNGPFCFQGERENERYRFNNSCVFIIMRAPNKPVMSSLPENIEPGTRITVKCSVNHTCSSHPPEITWNVPTAQKTISHNHMGGGVWETVSAVTFIPTGYEDKDEIACTATFWGGKTQENTALLSIRNGASGADFPDGASGADFLDTNHPEPMQI